MATWYPRRRGAHRSARAALSCPDDRPRRSRRTGRRGRPAARPRAALGRLRLRAWAPAHAAPLRARDRPAPGGRRPTRAGPGAGPGPGAARGPCGEPTSRRSGDSRPTRRRRRRTGSPRSATSRRSPGCTRPLPRWRVARSGRSEAILRGDVEHAYHPGGGLHHAMPERASGFCVYDDVALAIAAARRAGLRVLYVDLDVHHGDGVEAIHRDDPGVMTISLHESGRHLFPGTGAADEIGEGRAAGTVVNVPFEPLAGETAWLEAVRAVLPPLAAAFGPDLVVSQHGADSHAWDPLAHLRVTTTAMGAAARLVDALTHRHAGGRWLATGGGGYDDPPGGPSGVGAHLAGRRPPRGARSDPGRVAGALGRSGRATRRRSAARPVRGSSERWAQPGRGPGGRRGGRRGHRRRRRSRGRRRGCSS